MIIIVGQKIVYFKLYLVFQFYNIEEKLLKYCVNPIGCRMMHVSVHAPYGTRELINA